MKKKLSAQEEGQGLPSLFVGQCFLQEDWWRRRKMHTEVFQAQPDLDLPNVKFTYCKLARVPIHII